MSWGQRNARFFCEVDSARDNPERILGNKESGLHAVLAGEHGAISVQLRAVGSHDRFQVSFIPWRKSEGIGAIEIMSGLLDFDRAKKGSITMTMDDDLLEALALIQAKKLMIKGTAAEHE